MKKGIICIIFICIGVVAYFVIICDTYIPKIRKEKTAIPHVSRPVQTVKALPVSKTETRIFPGRVRANRRVKLAFSVSGLLSEINALEGQSVKKGDILARLDPRDFQYALDIAKAKYEETRQSLKRIQLLREKNVISVSDYEKVKAEYDIRLAELHICQKALKDTVLRAPFNGIIVDRYVENHEHIDKKEAILSFQDISVIEVVFQVPECIIMQGGAENLKGIQVCFDSEGKQYFEATLRESCNCSDCVTGTFDAAVVLKKRPELKILPGMTAMVQVKTFHHNYKASPGILLPIQAVFKDCNNKSYVWIIKPEGGNAQKREVKLGSLHNNGVEIISGLNAGENVAVSGIYSLHETIKVRPMNKGRDGLDG